MTSRPGEDGRRGLDGFVAIEWRDMSSVCQECGGVGEIIYGDGGGEGGKPTDTGFAEKCSACDGTGEPPLVAEAIKAVKADGG